MTETVSAPTSATAPFEQLAPLDAVSQPFQQAADRLVPQGSRVKDVLSGTWLGHPLHPALTDVVVGAWTSAFLLDRLRGKQSARAADRLILAGSLAAVPTALSGLSDWSDTRGGPRRVGTLHASANTLALLLHLASWRSRRRGRRGRGKLLSALGFGIAGFSAWLGGHLTYADGVGVNRTAFDTAPGDWTPVLPESQLRDGELLGARADGMPVLVTRIAGELNAIGDRCSHRGCMLHDGSLEGDTVVCRCHGSTFRLDDGSIVKGPATAPQPALDVRIENGEVQVRRRAA
jgi:nitrite reductase/ring-hydroxylating ferredoxin subunit